MKYSIIIGYRDRDVQRLVRCLSSLQSQTFRSYEIILVDYGSNNTVVSLLLDIFQKLPKNFHLILHAGQGHFWSRSHALNIGACSATGEILIFGDIDLIYPENFLLKVDECNPDDKLITYQCLYLGKKYVDFKSISSKSLQKLENSGNAAGLCIVSRKFFFNLGGYDEYYMVWGCEDNDFFERCIKAGLKHTVLDVYQCPVLHQWHPLNSPRGFPGSWYLEMVRYASYMRNQLKRNADIIWGKKTNSYDRLIKSTDLYENEKLVYLGIIAKYDYFNIIIDAISSLDVGERIIFLWQPLNIRSSRRVLLFFMKILQFSENTIARIASLFLRRSYITRENILQFFQWYIGINRPLIADYYIDSTRDCLKIILVKR